VDYNTTDSRATSMMVELDFLPRLCTKAYAPFLQAFATLAQKQLSAPGLLARRLPEVLP
jgi:hypothetical protein